MDTGFRCLACCRVFSTLGSLQEQVQYGVRKHFSCRAFHLTMAQLTGSVMAQGAQEEAEEEDKQQEENEEEHSTHKDLSTRGALSQCPGCVFNSPNDRKKCSTHCLVYSRQANSRRLNGILLSQRHVWWSQTAVRHREKSPLSRSVSPVRPPQESFKLLLRTNSRILKRILLSQRHVWWSQTAVRHREKSPLSRSISPACRVQESFLLLLRTEKWETSSIPTQDPFPPYLGRAPVKKIYYRPVQIKRGVAVSWDEVEVLEPASKKTKREFVFYEEAKEKGEEASDIWSRLSTRELVDVSDYSEASEETEHAGSAVEPPAQEETEHAGSAVEPPAQEETEHAGSAVEPPAQEETEQAGSAVEPPAQEESPRAKTPEWLVALDSGFRCLGCCWVFPSLEVLQDHVDNAVCEGFSCQVFHRILAWLNNKNKKEEEEVKNQCTII
ncbi:hypothetical protein MUG91_G213n5 [Manis pentadactyla]|nr:hypothetical protein MUG91_G213n5 [Manis pentadactyla]